jgi:hypothetical protein
MIDELKPSTPLPKKSVGQTKAPTFLLNLNFFTLNNLLIVVV